MLDIRLHHVTNGDSLSTKFSAAGIPGSVSVWCDILHEGPVPAGQPLDELFATRARYGSDKGYGDYDELVATFREWRQAIAHRDRDELVLWYEHDLFDQLNLIQLLDYLAETRPVPRVTLVSIDRFPGCQKFRGMGELRPEELATLFPSRAPVEDAQLDLARRAWAAFRAPTPEALHRLLATDTSALPYLAPALTRHLEEFPAADNGLSRTEQQLLQAVASRPMSVTEAFRKSTESESCFFIGDSSFWTVVVRNATLMPALLDVEIERLSNQALPEGIIRITPTGREVAAGQADRIALYGIDRWLGGVHVTTEHPWRRPAVSAV